MNFNTHNNIFTKKLDENYFQIKKIQIYCEIIKIKFVFKNISTRRSMINFEKINIIITQTMHECTVTNGDFRLVFVFLLVVGK